MRFFPREAWLHYASLLIVCFALAALAVWHTLRYVHALPLSGIEYTNIAVRVWLITLGFMFITGAFGLWAIQFSTEIETLRRIGRMVDSMDYIRDGLLAIDKKGTITGSNPVIESITHTVPGENAHISQMFPCLSQNDINVLLDNDTPQELEREFAYNDSRRTLRFRSQPSGGFTLILVSDVTAMTAQHLHRKQIAQLQLIGQIAKGVAHDFNNILCVIAGHASLLKRLPPDSPELHRSIETIISNTGRGTTLAGHLLELSRQGVSRQPTNMSHEYVRSAVQMLQGSISTDWRIETDIHNLPTAPITGIQIEQVVLNLSMLASDTLPHPGVLRISASRPSGSGLLDVAKKYASIILISASPDGARPEAPANININEIETGVILSVIQSMLEEAGCSLEHFIDKTGTFTFRVAMPMGNITLTTETEELSKEMEAYVANWSLLLGTTLQDKEVLVERLSGIGTKILKVNNITSILAHIEEDTYLDAIILDEIMLSQEVRGLLKAIIKLRPSAGILILCDDPDSMAVELSTDVVFESKSSSPDRILLSVIEAKNMALRRKA